MFHTMRLGRISAPIPDGVPTLDQHPIMQAPVPPSLRERDALRFQPTMGGNDQIGDCAPVALANCIRAQAKLNRFDVAIPDPAIIDLYRQVSGYDPDHPETDRGCVVVDLLTWQAQQDFHVGDGIQDGYSGLWANIPVDNLDLLRRVVARIGCGFLGVNLAEADQWGSVWDTDTPADQGDPRPGSWGPHGLMAWSYDGLEETSLWELGTWGRIQRCTTRWLRSRLEEAHLVYHLQLLGPSGRNFAGLDHDRLAADVASFGAIA